MTHLTTLRQQIDEKFDSKFNIGGFDNYLETISPLLIKQFTHTSILEVLEALEEMVGEVEKLTTHQSLEIDVAQYAKHAGRNEERARTRAIYAQVKEVFNK